MILFFHKKINTPYFFIFLLLFFHFTSSFVWLKLDNRPPAWDQSTHLNISLDLLEEFSAGRLNPLKAVLEKATYYPPLYHAMLVPFHKLFGISEDNFIYVNTFFLFILFLSLYKLGETLYSKSTGVLSVFVLSMYPFILVNYRNCLLDLPLASMVTLSVLMVLKGNDFNNKKYSLLLGITAGLAMLVKWAFIFFAVIPFLFYACKLAVNYLSDRELKKRFSSAGITVLFAAIVCMLPFILGSFKVSFALLLIVFILFYFKAQNQNRNAESMKNYCLCVIIAVIIASPWYLHNILKLAGGFFSNVSGAVEFEKDPPVFSFQSFSYYFKALEGQMSLYFVLPLVVGVIYALIKPGRINRDMLLWLLGGFTVITLLGNKDMRFTVPLLPLLSVLSVYWIGGLDSKIFRRSVILLIVLVASVVFYFNGFSPVKLKSVIHERYSGKDWKTQPIIEEIRQLGGGRPVSAVALSNYDYFHSGAFKFIYRKYHFGENSINFRPFETNLAEFTDYLVFKTGDKGSSIFLENEFEEAIKSVEEPAGNFSKAFKAVYREGLPDGSTAFVFRLDPAPGSVKQADIDRVKKSIKYNLALYGPEGASVNVDIVPVNKIETLRGHYKSLIIKISRATMKGLPLDNFKLVLENVYVNLQELDNNRLIFMRIDEIKPVLALPGEGIKEFISGKTKDFVCKYVSVKNNKIIIEGKIKAISLVAGIGMKINEDYLDLSVDGIKVAGFFRIPVYLAGTIQRFPLKPSWSWPVTTRIDKFSADDNMIKVNY